MLESFVGMRLFFELDEIFDSHPPRRCIGGAFNVWKSGLRIRLDERPACHRAWR